MAQLMMAVNVVLVVLTLWACTQGLLLDDPACTLQLASQAEAITVPSQCTTGRLWLNYTPGSLQVNFQQDRAFIVCLTPDSEPWLGSIIELVDGHKVFEVTEFGGGTFCLPRSGNHVTAILEQTPTQVSVPLINFTIRYT